MHKFLLAPFLSVLLLYTPPDASELQARIKTVVDDNFAMAQAYQANVPGILVGVWSAQSGLDMTYAVGVGNKVGPVVLTDEHSFKIASVTKTMVVTVICQLIDEGKLDFDTPVSTYFPNLLAADRVTIRMLGDMTSGYFDYLEDDDFLDNFDNTANFTATPDEMIAVSMSHGLQYEPGHGFNYSNTNTVILGQIIEQITGNPLETELQTRLFDPLGLVKTGAPSSGSYLPHPRAHSYHPTTLEDWTEKMDYSPEYACGNAYSTLRELRVWVEALAKGTLVSAETYEHVFDAGTPFPGAEDHVYHFGMIDYNGYLGHSGDTDYYLTEAYYNPRTDTTIVVLANSSLDGITGTVINDIMAALVQ